MVAKKRKPMVLEPRYLKDLNKLLDEIFICSKNVWKYTHNELAVKAKLAPTTVYKLAECTTRLPRLHTVWKLARAVEMELVISKRYPKIARKAS